jgi:hypothetical protein
VTHRKCTPIKILCANVYYFQFSVWMNIIFRRGLYNIGTGTKRLSISANNRPHLTSFFGFSYVRMFFGESINNWRWQQVLTNREEIVRVRGIREQWDRILVWLEGPMENLPSIHDNSGREGDIIWVTAIPNCCLIRPCH